MTAPDEDEILAMEDAGPEVIGLPGRFTLNVHAEDAYDVEEAGAKRAFSNDAYDDAFVFDEGMDDYDEAASLEETERVVRGSSTAGARQRTVAPRPATVAWGATFVALAGLAGAVVAIGALIGVVRWWAAEPVAVEAPPVVVEAPAVPVVPVAAEPEPVPEPEPAVVEPEPAPKVAAKPRKPKPAPEPAPVVAGAPAPVVEAPPPPVAEPQPEKKKGLFRKKKD